jgi:hypothetical protein
MEEDGVQDGRLKNKIQVRTPEQERHKQHDHARADSQDVALLGQWLGLVAILLPEFGRQQPLEQSKDSRCGNSRQERSGTNERPPPLPALRAPLFHLTEFS